MRVIFHSELQHGLREIARNLVVACAREKKCIGFRISSGNTTRRVFEVISTFLRVSPLFECTCTEESVLNLWFGRLFGFLQYHCINNVMKILNASNIFVKHGEIFN